MFGRISISCTAFALLSAVLIFLCLHHDSGIKLEPHLLEFESARAFIFGKSLAQIQVSGKVLIITGWDEEGKELASLQLEHLKKGLGPGFTSIVIERLEIERYRKGAPCLLSRKISGKTLDELIEKHPDLSMLISTIGMPGGFEKMRLFKKPAETRPRLALLNCEPWRLGNALRMGYLSAISSYRPGWTCNSDIPSDPQEAFDLRYLLITSGNVDEIAKTYKGLIK